MKHWPLLRAMMVKELRTSMREPQQLISLVASLAVLLAVVAAAGLKFKQRMSPVPPMGASTRPIQTRPATQLAAPHGHDMAATLGKIVPYVDTNVIRWICLGGGTAAGVFFSLGYIISATLASFAGEKDEHTLELLLASPIDDTTLYLTKCLSILLPMSAVGYLFLLLPVLGGSFLLRQEMARAPVCVPFYVLVLSIPVLLLVQAALVSLGAAISAKAETLKGANQAFGGIFVVIFIGGGYGIPLAIRYTPLRTPAIHFGRAWLFMPFALQYLILLLALALLATVITLIARSLFRRDRLLG